MATDEEIRTAERAVIEAARMLRPKPSEHFLAVALAELDALKSPLPSREKMARANYHLRQDSTGDSRIAEAHWADCLRWVAKVTGDTHAYRAPPPLRDDLCKWADELDARK